MFRGVRKTFIWQWIPHASGTPSPSVSRGAADLEPLPALLGLGGGVAHERLGVRVPGRGAQYGDDRGRARNLPRKWPFQGFAIPFASKGSSGVSIVLVLPTWAHWNNGTKRLEDPRSTCQNAVLLISILKHTKPFWNNPSVGAEVTRHGCNCKPTQSRKRRVGAASRRSDLEEDALEVVRQLLCRRVRGSPEERPHVPHHQLLNLPRPLPIVSARAPGSPSWNHATIMRCTNKSVQL